MASQSPSSSPTPGNSLEDGNNECTICHEAFNVSPEGEEEVEPVAGPSTRPVKRARFVPEVDVAVCGHIFHKFCIHRWLKTGGKECPLCRKKTTKRGLRRIFNFPSTGPQDEGRKFEDKVLEVEEMKKELEEEKGKVEGMEEMMKQVLVQIEDVRRNFEGKVQEVDDLWERVEEMKGTQRELEEKLEEKEEEVEDLKDTVKRMKGVEMKLEGKLEEMSKDIEAAQGKMREDLEEAKKEGEREVKNREKDLGKMMELNRELEKKLKIEERKNEFGEKLFVERMEERVSEEHERMKKKKEVEVKIRDWEAMYKLCKMERDKEMGKAAYFENWCKRLVGIEESSKCDVADLTEIMGRKLNGGDADATTTALKFYGDPISIENTRYRQLKTGSKSNFKIESIGLSELESNADEMGQDHTTGASFWKDFPFEDYLHLSEEDNIFSDDGDNVD